ncbi:hypothetical protein DFH06DRAFT_1319742 [Mycena polygramma]|nr:hypothetical protein DFH06DRAFT_1319742 [Mycena polygramma]
MFSNASVAEDEGELTDPGEGKEAFVSLTPAFLASTAESAISVLVARATSRVRGSTDPSRPHILSHLKNDEMWPNLPQFVASGTLAVHKCEGRAWRLMYGINVCATKAGWMRSVDAFLSVCVDYHGAPSLLHRPYSRCLGSSTLMAIRHEVAPPTCVCPAAHDRWVGFSLFGVDRAHEVEHLPRLVEVVLRSPIGLVPFRAVGVHHVLRRAEQVHQSPSSASPENDNPDQSQPTLVALVPCGVAVRPRSPRCTACALLCPVKRTSILEPCPSLAGRSSVTHLVAVCLEKTSPDPLRPVASRSSRRTLPPGTFHPSQIEFDGNE